MRIVIICLLFSLNVSAQIGMQQWRIHFSAFTAQGLVEANNAVFMACSNGLIQYDLEDNSINLLTVTNGLSDLGISALGTDGSTVMVGYQNGNLDVINGSRIVNVPWIKLAEISGDKTIHSIHFNEGYAYVNTGIGTVVYNIEKDEIQDTYYPYSNPVVYDATVHNDTLYLATENGIWYAHVNAPFLNDQNNWTKKTNLPATVINQPFTQIESFNDELVFVYKSTQFDEDSIYFEKNGNVSVFNESPVTVFDAFAKDNKLYICLYSAIIVITESHTIETTLFGYKDGVPQPRGCTFIGSEFWVADNNHGLVRAYDSWNNRSVFSNGPATDGSYRLDIQYGKVLIAGGGLTENLNPNFFRNGVYLFENESWTNFNYKTQDSIDFDNDWDFISVAVNYNNTDEMAFSSNSNGGLKVIKDGETISEVYTHLNSTIEQYNNRINIGDIKYDDQGNLWLVNQGLEPLKMMTPDGQWYSFSLGSAAKNQIPYRLMIDHNGNKWVCVTHVGLIAFNENGTPGDPSDDQLRVMGQGEGNGNLPSVFVKGLAEDIDGEIWIGTEEGLVILYNTGDIFDGGYGDYDASPILIEVNGEVERLFGESTITAIAIDGGNRKWIGTSSSGVFCLSPEGTTEVYRFTSQNSPLISNNILDIRVDHLTGEVFFATDKGLVSFRSDATLGDDEFSSVKVYPNPVEPDYAGAITIQGLGYEADVKITDVSGNLVYQGTSNGGTFIWNGNTLYGDRVQSGVYLVWSGITTGKGKEVAKILFIH